MNKEDLARVHRAIPRLTDELAGGRIGRREFLRTTTLLGLSAGAAYALAGRITGHAVPAAAAQEAGAQEMGAPRQGGVLRVSMNVKDIIDPAAFDWSEKGNLARQVIEPLCRVGSDNITRPYLCERWEASDDLMRWTLHLRRGVTWNNGDDFIADDVIANFERWLDPAAGSSNYGRFALMRGPSDGDPMIDGAVVKIDDHTVQINLRQPMLSLPESLGDYPCLMVHRDFVAMGANFQENPIGTGPFLLTDFAIARRAEYVRRDPADYWGDPVHLDGLVYIDHGDDPAAWLAALASGQVDLLFRMMTEQVPAARSIPGLQLYEMVTAQTGVARMKVTAPPFDNPTLRQAIRACIDHRAILDIANQGAGVPAEDHHVCPIHPEYAELPAPQQDYQKAQRLLAEAGYPDGIDLSIDCVAQPTWEPNACQVIAEMLRPVGINLAVNVMPGGTYWDRWLVAPFGFTSWAHRPLGTQVLNLAYRSGVPWNESSYANPEFDQLLDTASGTLDVKERRAIMAQLQAILQDDSVIVQPFWRTVSTASTERVIGFQHHPAEEQWLHNVWLDA